MVDQYAIEFDPDDQFFQAFKAGYMAACSTRQERRLNELAKQLDLDRTFWTLYVGWLYRREGDDVAVA